MKYAIISDIHGNLPAWQAFWRDRLKHGVEAVICLGDIVGYGPRPAEVLARVRKTTQHILMGNHDAAVCGLFGAENFNDEARHMVEVTRSLLSDEAYASLRSLPYVLELECAHGLVALTHASMCQPDQFPYIFTERDARRCWAACEAVLVFVGHTHLPRVMTLAVDNTYSVGLPNAFIPERRKRYIVNTGSVGMPRVNELYASYCTYDTETQMVQWHRVTYETEGYRRDVLARLGDTREARELLNLFLPHPEHPQRGVPAGTEFPISAMRFR